MFVIGIDLGGTRLRTGLFDEQGRLINRIEALTNGSEGPEAVIAKMKQQIYEACAGICNPTDKNQVVGIGIGSPGPLNPYSGVVISPPNLPGWTNIPLKDILEKEFSVPIYLNNDANSAVLGEYFFGRGKGIENLIYLTISTGIGAGIICDGRLLLGAQGSAGEVGHMTIDPQGALCGCGNFGCFEALASGTGIAKRMHGKQEAKGQIRNFTTKEIFEEARNANTLALEVVEETRKCLGIGLANIINLYNPQMIVFGGGVTQVGDFLLQPAIDIARERALNGLAEDVDFVVTGLGGDVGVIGAAALVRYSELLGRHSLDRR